MTRFQKQQVMDDLKRAGDEFQIAAQYVFDLVDERKPLTLENLQSACFCARHATEAGVSRLVSIVSRIETGIGWKQDSTSGASEK